MPMKIGFQVVSASGEDERYRAAELNYHGPTVRGWRSEVSCIFPQEIILQLKVLTILQKIQILSHQYLIPQKIEICTCSSLQTNTQLQNVPDLFENIGFITFSDNKATGFRSRELKSVFIPRIQAKYVKLIIHDNHMNIKNIFNQVGLMGINILGEEVQKTFDKSEINEVTSSFSYSSFPYGIMNNANYTSPYDDLAFEMYVDEETARIIKKIEHKKYEAVFEENFDYANTLKLVLENLRAAGEIIGLYEQEKKQAIQFEDYDRAKSKKLQIDNFRQKIYIELQIDEILKSEQLKNDRNTQNHEKDYLELSCGGENYENQILIENNNKKLINLKSKLDNFNTKNKLSQKKGEFYRFFKGENVEENNNFIQSKSQSSLSEQTEPPPTEFHKRTTFSKSSSIPYINQYLKQKQGQQFQSTCQKSKTYNWSELTSPVETPLTSPSSEEDELIPSSFTEYHAVNFKGKKITHRSKDRLIASPNSSRISNDKTYDSLDGSKYPSQSYISISSDKPFENSTESAAREEMTKSEDKNGATNMTKSSFEIYEDSMLPALRSYQKNEIFRECQLLLDKQVKTSLNEREKKQAMLPISVFGIQMIEKFYSKNFSDKEEGLEELQLELRRLANLKDENDNSTKLSYNKIARAALFLLHRTLRDTVFSVYSKAAETIRQFFKEFVPQRVSQSEVAKSVEKLLPELLTKSGDVTPRIHNMAAHTLLSISECEEVRRLNIIPSQLSRPLTSSVHPRLALSRLEMVEQLMLNQGISKDKRSGLTCRTLAEFGSSGLHHPAEAVRKVSERILLQVYKVNPKIVRKQLPPDDNITRRNLLYRQLFQEFDFMDLQQQSKSTNNQIIKKSLSENTKINSEESTVMLSENLVSTKISSPKIVKKQLHLDLQLETLKHCKSLYSGENKNRKVSPKHGSNIFPKELKNKYQNNDSIQEKQEATKLVPILPKDTFKTKNRIPILKKTTAENFETKKKSPLNTVENKNRKTSATSILKFPSLTDSIDIATVRILLNKDAEKNIRQKKESVISQKKCENGITFNKSQPSQPCQELTSKKERKAIRHTSNIPISITHSKKTRLSNAVKKSPNETVNGSDFKKNKIKTPEILNQTLQINCEPIMKNGTIEIEITQSQKLENLPTEKEEIRAKNNEPNLKEENINFENNIKMEESYRFSDSMLASIRDNEFMENNLSNKQEDQTRLKSCIFCLSSKKWTKEDDLNKHYLSDCPMLMACEYCMEVVEISGYTNHLLDECDQKHLFKKCLKCLQAVLEDFYNTHECKAMHYKKNKARCLFCHTDLTDDESSWRKHLMGGINACSNHPKKNVI